jgi:hypothetical protein
MYNMCVTKFTAPAYLRPLPRGDLNTSAEDLLATSSIFLIKLLSFFRHGHESSVTCYQQVGYC